MTSASLLLKVLLCDCEKFFLKAYYFFLKIMNSVTNNSKIRKNWKAELSGYTPNMLSINHQ